MSCPALLHPTYRAASVVTAPIAASSLVDWMTIPTFPQIISLTVPGHLVGRGVAWVPVVTNPGLIGHGLALAEGVWAPAFTVGADSSASIVC